MSEDLKKIIGEAKHICLIPSSTNEPTSLIGALAFFYILRELHKNVNFIVNEFPERFHFLLPSLDFIASPKNMVISIPKEVADVSQIYYEKNDHHLKIHLSVDRGIIKKDHISLYVAESKPDVIVTIGISNFQQELTDNLNSFGYLLNTPIINIDYHPENLGFGSLNIVEKKSLSEILLHVIETLSPDFFTQSPHAQKVANCLLAGLLIQYDSFKQPHMPSTVFEIASRLTRHGADHYQIIHALQKISKEEMDFLYKIFQNLTTADRYDGSWSLIPFPEFQHFGESEASVAVTKMRSMGIYNTMLVAWQSQTPEPTIKGFFYSDKQHLVNRMFTKQSEASPSDSPIHMTPKHDWIFFSMPGSDLTLAKDRIISLI